MSGKTRIYVAGPMSGLPDFNYHAFNAAARQLRALGYRVENPAECVGAPHWEWLDYMRAGITQLMSCNAVALLPGWSSSKGACVEVSVARGLGFDVRDVAEWGAPVGAHPEDA